ncbi:MAG TPA: MSMEG_4193 family putative phosphomutase [Anaerolineales bacterium]|nr:MSMEG_4193 family putative phosphomutase [Anaerolineales bacterium]HEX3049619.1 MSMEG_4193 family putative phosphomutase [Aggregatilineaceae bacterium]
MTEFFLIRHATNDYVKTGRLAGWTTGVHLNGDGQNQAAALGERLKESHLTAIYSSPLERTMETAQAIIAHHPQLAIQPLNEVGEIDFGEWQGQKLSQLRREKMWETVQVYPSRTHFPHGESFMQAQSRAVEALEKLAVQHPNGRVAVVSHSDLIKLVLAYYLGAHIDLFQRVEISPASLTIIQLGSNRPYIVRVNDTSYLPVQSEIHQKPSRLARLRRAVGV